MSTSPPPLLVTADERLLDELLRLAAAAGTTPEVARDVPAALRAWPRAPLVLVGHDLADPLARASPSRREGVFVVLLAPTPDAVFRSALAVGAESVAELPRSEGWLVERLTDVVDTGPARGLTPRGDRWLGRLGGDDVRLRAGPGGGAVGSVVGRRRRPARPGGRPGAGARSRRGGPVGRRRAHDRPAQRPGAARVACRGAAGVAALTWYAGPQPPTLQAFAVREVLSAARRGSRHGGGRPAARSRSAGRRDRVPLRPAAGDGGADGAGAGGRGADVPAVRRPRHRRHRRPGRRRRRRRAPPAHRRTGRDPDARPARAGGGHRPRPGPRAHPPRPSRPGAPGWCSPARTSPTGRPDDRRAGRAGPRAARPRPRAADTPPGGRGAAGLGPTGGRRDGARGPRPPPARRGRRRSAGAAAAAVGVTDVLVNGPDQVFVDRGEVSSSSRSRSPTTTPYAASPSGWLPREATARRRDSPRRRPTA